MNQQQVMIAKATVVSYGGNATRYSANKEEAEIVKVHHLPPDISASGMWTMMHALQLKYRDKLNRHRPMVNTSIRIEVSPSEEESAGWTMKEWRKLADKFIREFDSVDLSGRAKRDSAKSTNLRNSQYVVSLHHDSDSGILHLHINANRIDMDGNVNDAHFIHERAMEAAKQVSIEYGWVLAEEIRKNHINTLSDDCKAILEEMRSFSWEAYEAKLNKRGYSIEFRRDSMDTITGYSILWGNSRYKSSLLGERRFTPSRIIDTWRRLHPEAEQLVLAKPHVERPAGTLSRQNSPQPKLQASKKDSSNVVHQEIIVDEDKYRVVLPRPIYSFFLHESTAPEYNPDSSRAKVVHTAMLLFAEYVDGATQFAENCGGGGRSSSDDWGQKRDDDDWTWARRCLKWAQESNKRKNEYRRRR